MEIVPASSFWVMMGHVVLALEIVQTAAGLLDFEAFGVDIEPLKSVRFPTY